MNSSDCLKVQSTIPDPVSPFQHWLRVKGWTKLNLHMTCNWRMMGKPFFTRLLRTMRMPILMPARKWFNTRIHSLPG